MFLSGRDIKWAIDCGKLIVDPRPEDLDPPKGYDETSIDLHLGPIKDAAIWDIDKLVQEATDKGEPTHDGAPELRVGSFVWERFREKQIPIPDGDDKCPHLVYKHGSAVVVRRFGFVLWQTKEKVGTPKVDPNEPTKTQRHPELICFVDAKSTRARTGLMVHFTAPTIHANWFGTVTLEITNLGPFTFVLREGDALAQLTVATISSAPDLRDKKSVSQTHGQTSPKGRDTTKT